MNKARLFWRSIWFLVIWAIGWVIGAKGAHYIGSFSFLTELIFIIVAGFYMLIWTEDIGVKMDE